MISGDFLIAMKKQFKETKKTNESKFFILESKKKQNKQELRKKIMEFWQIEVKNWIPLKAVSPNLNVEKVLDYLFNHPTEI